MPAPVAPCGAKGQQTTSACNLCLFNKYSVLPEYYEDLGDGIYQVYVEVGGEIVFIGTPKDMAERAQTITAECLRRSL